MSHPYTVALEEASVLPCSHRIAAEARFAAVIERALGGPEAVATTYRAWVNASESGANDADQATASLAVQWPRAYDTARQAGFRDLGEIPGPTSRSGWSASTMRAPESKRCSVFPG